MTQSRTFHLEHPIAQRLADLSGIANDLRLTVRAADLFLSLPTVGSEEAIVGSKGLASFAIITYFRTLATGVRSGVNLSQIEKLPPAMQRSHHELKAIRDGYVAHSKSGLERTVVEVVLTEDGTGIHTLGTMHSRPGTFSKEHILSLRALAEALHSLVDEEYDLEFNRVWDFLENMPANERSRILTPPEPYGAPSPQKKRHRLGG